MPAEQDPVARLTLGAANLGNLYEPMSDASALALLETAWSEGVRSFDTAPHYGLGLSERRLGSFLAGMPREQFTLSTKVGHLLRDNPAGAGRLDDEHQFAVPATMTRLWDASGEGIRRSLEESLERLGLDRVDTLYLHDPEEHGLEPSLGTALPALAELREHGIVSRVGVGSKSLEALLRSIDAGSVDELMVAGRHTLVDSSAAAQLLPRCTSMGVSVAAAAVFNSGLLSTPRPTEAGRFEYAVPPPRVLQRVQQIADVCLRVGTDLPTAALHFPLRSPAVRTVVAGAASAQQVRQNAERMRKEPPAELWPALAERGLLPHEGGQT